MSEEQRPSQSSQLNALRTLHKIEKQKKGTSLSIDNSGGSDHSPQREIAVPSKGNSSGGPAGKASINSVRNTNSEPFKDSDRPQSRNNKKLPPVTQQKRDISITLSAYNVQLKKAEDKEFYKLREEFNHALVKLESLDTRDRVVNLNKGNK